MRKPPRRRRSTDLLGTPTICNGSDRLMIGCRAPQSRFTRFWLREKKAGPSAGRFRSNFAVVYGVFRLAVCTVCRPWRCYFAADRIEAGVWCAVRGRYFIKRV